MKRLTHKWKVIHKIFREGKLTHSDGAGMVRITFNKPTGGIRQRDVPVDSFDVDPPPAPSAMLNALSGGPVKRDIREEAAHCANELFHRRKQCPDATATERLHKEFLIGLLGRDIRLQQRAWWTLMLLAEKYVTGLFHPDHPPVLAVRRRDTFVIHVANELFVGWVTDKETYDPRYFVRVVRQRCIDVLRKHRTVRRQQQHNVKAPDMFEMFNTEDANGLDTTGKPWHRKQRSDIGKARGRYKRKGEPQK
jgi:hypothetical protein